MTTHSNEKKDMKKSKRVKQPYFQYFPTSLKNIVLSWSHQFMSKKDWEVEAIDVARDRVIFRRLEKP